MADKVMTIESWTDGGDNIVRLLGLGARSYILSAGHDLAQVKRETRTSRLHLLFVIPTSHL